MADHFINLNCTNCGAKLDVYDDMERFACGYCGTEMIVQRRGGTVALKAVTEAIKKVQIGTDKTAAELALVRLRQERSELVTQFATVPRPPQQMTWGCFTTVALVVTGVAAWIDPVIGGAIGGMTLAVVAGILIAKALIGPGTKMKDDRSKWQKAKADYDFGIASLDQEIARLLEVVSHSPSDAGK